MVHLRAVEVLVGLAKSRRATIPMSTRGGACASSGRGALAFITVVGAGIWSGLIRCCGLAAADASPGDGNADVDGAPP